MLHHPGLTFVALESNESSFEYLQHHGAMKRWDWHGQP